MPPIEMKDRIYLPSTSKFKFTKKKILLPTSNSSSQRYCNKKTDENEYCPSNSLSGNDHVTVPTIKQKPKNFFSRPLSVGP